MGDFPSGWKQRSTKQSVAIVLLIFMSMVLSFVEFSIIPEAEWLKYDTSGVVSLIATFLYGPWIGTGVAFASWIPHLLNNPIGSFMNIAMMLTLIIVAGEVYRRKPCFSRAILGCACGTVLACGVAICLNFAVTPAYMGASYEEILALLLPAILPFNLFKALANSFLAVISYRRLALLLGSSRDDEPQARADA